MRGLSRASRLAVSALLAFSAALPASLAISGTALGADDTVTTLTTTTPYIAAGAGATLTAVVTDTSSGSTIATGTVSITSAASGSINCDNLSLSSGEASCTVDPTFLPVGTSQFVATYTPDPAFNASATTQPTPIVVGATSTSLAANPMTTSAGGSTTLTATVTALGGGTPTGVVEFSEGTMAVACQTGSTATSCIVSNLSEATHIFTATYVPDTTTFTGSSGTVNVVVQKVATTTKLETSTTSPLIGQTVTFTATVDQPGATGLVTFADETTPATLCATNLDANSQASCSLASLSIGSHSIVATYAGSSTFTGSASSAVTVTVRSDSGGIAPLQPQTITFTMPPSGSTGDKVVLLGSASSGLTVHYATTTPLICSVSVTVLTLIAPGTCLVTATQPGDGWAWAAAVPVSGSMAVTGAALPKTTVSLVNRLGVNKGKINQTVAIVFRGAAIVNRLYTSKALTGTTIELWWRLPGKAWAKLTTRRVDVYGYATYSFTASRSFLLRWKFLGNARFFAGYSNYVTLNLR